MYSNTLHHDQSSHISSSSGTLPESLNTVSSQVFKFISRRFYVSSTASSSQATSRETLVYPSDLDEESSASVDTLFPIRQRRASLHYDKSRRWNGLMARHRCQYGVFGWFRYRRLRYLVKGLPYCTFTTKQTIAVILALLVFSMFAVSLTLLLIYILNPDKVPLPWRAYCSIPPPFNQPSSSSLSASLSSTAGIDTLIKNISSSTPLFSQAFPMEVLDLAPPVGLFLGVFSTDSALDRRMLIRSTWASHFRSRRGAGVGDNGIGTSRTLVRFIMGKPRKRWQRRIQLEAETYNDIVILPISENMNSGKTHTFFSWAANHAWVPPVSIRTDVTFNSQFSYTEETSDFILHSAPHDPYFMNSSWVRPDFVVKVDDDSFVMLAELEARLRNELYSAQSERFELKPQSTDEYISPNSIFSDNNATRQRNSQFRFMDQSYVNNDPLIYWGYLVKNKFMAGELYALSWSLVSWIGRDPVLKSMITGKEDKLVAKWMDLHPRSSEIRWTSEPCWIYDHPRAGTVYSHGFLFPSEVTRVKKNILDSLRLFRTSEVYTETSRPPQVPSTLSSWAHSSVSTFGIRYTPPHHNISLSESIEALVEGSGMSLLREYGQVSPEQVWRSREGRLDRYQGRRVGGTVVVHFIKQNPWFLETAIALLEGDDVI